MLCVMCSVDRSEGSLGVVGQSTIQTEKVRHSAKRLTRDRDVSPVLLEQEGWRREHFDRFIRTRRRLVLID